MAITLETIHREIQQVRGDLHVLKSMLEDESELTDEARQELKKARKEMDRGDYISHEEIKAKYR